MFNIAAMPMFNIAVMPMFDIAVMPMFDIAVMPMFNIAVMSMFNIVVMPVFVDFLFKAYTTLVPDLPFFSLKLYISCIIYLLVCRNIKFHTYVILSIS